MLRRATGKTDRLSRWALAIQARRGTNVAAVALANKLARIAWAVLDKEGTYQANWSPIAPQQAILSGRARGEPGFVSDEIRRVITIAEK